MSDKSNLGEEKMSKSANAQKHHHQDGDVDRLLQEINLLNLERFLFSTDRKRSVDPGTVLEYTDSDGTYYRIKIGEYGQPGTLAYRVFHAALYKVVHNGKECSGNVC